MAALGLAGPSAHAASYPPGYHFRTVSNDRVSVHFHQGYEAMAREAAALAAELLARHEQRYRQTVGRVQIVLVDADDEANGFASPLPYPFVTIRAAAPAGDDAFGNHEGWLRLALTHELAHVVHLEEARGVWRVGRHVFGRAPFLFPNTLAMSWMIEGLATFEETELTAFGRGRNADSRMVLRMAALDRRFPGEDQAIYGLDAWPGGQAPYLFGEAFLRRLSGQSGDGTLPRLARQHATQLLPFLDGRTVKKVTGAGLDAQWRAWAGEAAQAFARETEDRRRAGLTRATGLTKRGIRQSGPRFSPDGAWIAYTSGTLTRFPQLRLMRPDGSEDHPLVLRNGGSGLAWTPDGRALVMAELQVHHTFAVFGDLSLVEVPGGAVRRLTRGARAADPDVSPDGRTVVFVRKLGDRSDLFTVGIGGEGLARLTSSAPGVEWSGPRFDPDGDAVVASRLLPGGWLDLVRVDRTGGAIEQLTHDRAADVEPTWTPDGQAVVFRSDRDGIPNLYALRLSDRSLVRVTNVLGGAFQPSVSPDGRTVAYSDYSSRGFDVATTPLELAAAPPAAAYVDTHPAPRPDPLPESSPARPYRAWGMLLPHFWSPWFEAGGEETRVGAATGGSDALFHHVWALRGTYGTQTQRANVSGLYLYDRFRTTLLVTGQDTSERFSRTLHDGGSVAQTQRTRRLNLQASLPLRRTIRSLQTLSVTYRREREEVPGSARPEDRSDVGGIETAWALSSARSYPYSISATDGGLLSLAWLHAARALGSDDTFDKLTLDARGYRPLFGSRDVVAAHVALGTSTGRPRYQPFSVGGYPDSALFDAGANLTVLRGYPDDAFAGRRFAGANLEYRFPLVTPQRGWRSLPVFLRHLHGTLFVDAANAWSGAFRARDVRTAAGASLGVDTALGYTLPVTAELTFARGFGSRGDTRVYLRFGLAF
ncbi:MAG: BamA/TamA family outer membrane protein [Betaproteobacteria bacterium]